MADSVAHAQKVALKLGADGPFKTAPTSRLVQLLFNGVYIVRTTRAVHVWEQPYYPQLYIPVPDLSRGIGSKFELKQGEEIKLPSGLVIAVQYTLTVGARSIASVVVFASHLPAPSAALAGLARVDFDAVDQWFEEDTPIYVHPKDPFKRVDTLASTRPVRVSLGGKVVARTTSSVHLYETGLPTRYYLPFSAILDPSALKPSSKKTKCPYKGEAEYYSVELDGTLYEDIVWYYRSPILEVAKIEGMVCFYNEKSEIELDGESLTVPVTHFTKGTGKPSAVGSSG